MGLKTRILRDMKIYMDMTIINGSCVPDRAPHERLARNERTTLLRRWIVAVMDRAKPQERIYKVYIHSY